MQQLFQTATVVHAAIARLTTEQESSTQIHALKKAKNFMAASATFKNTVLTLWRF
tara:strand:+ start:103 stop:267 length:165 start_codon:yes stop_codon:yes gene_type:complete